LDLAQVRDAGAKCGLERMHKLPVVANSVAIAAVLAMLAAG